MFTVTFASGAPLEHEGKVSAVLGVTSDTLTPLWPDPPLVETSTNGGSLVMVGGE